MAMTKKKGVIVFKKNNKLKVVYSHYDAQYDGLGEKVVAMCRELGLQGLNDLYDRLVMVDEETPMTEEQKAGYKPFIPAKVWTDDITWTQTMIYTRNIVEVLMSGYSWAVDYSGFCGAWRNRFRYVIDLDNNNFGVVKAGLEMLSQQDDEYFKDAMYVDKVAHTRIGDFPLDNIPEDWADQCNKKWGSKMMIVAVDYSKNAAAQYSEKVQADANGDRDWEMIKFYYGDNTYEELFNTVD